MDQPVVIPRDLITIDKSYKKAVVCRIAENNEIEVVYMDHKGQIINENMRWDGKVWKFIQSGPSGGYAGNNPRLKEFVGILKSAERSGR